MKVKNSILAAGVQLLKNQGIAALTQTRVAESAGIKQSHLTYYFPKRTDLLLAIAEFAVNTILDEIEAEMQYADPQTTIADKMSDAMIKGIPPRIIIGLIVAAEDNPAIRTALQKLILKIRNHLQLILTKANVNASDDVTLIFHATIVGLAVMHEAQQNSKSTGDIMHGIRILLDLITDGDSTREH